MAKLNLSGWRDREDVEEDYGPHKLSSPMPYFWTMVLFLIIVVSSLRSSSARQARPSPAIPASTG